MFIGPRMFPACSLLVIAAMLTLASSIPNHVIFDEDNIGDRQEFKTRLQRLQNTVALYVSKSTLFRSSANDIQFIYKSLFEEFIELFQRRYHDDKIEYDKRFIIFKQSLQRQSLLNIRESEANGTAKYGINKFSDWTEEEFLSLLKPKKTHVTFLHHKNVTVNEGRLFNSYATDCVVFKSKEQSADWRRHISGVKDQKSCGGCWAFVASEQLETYASIKGRPLVTLSPQELISCSPSLGCSGGNTCGALEWLRKTNKVLVSEKDYPYEEKETACRYDDIEHIGVGVKEVCGCTNMVATEEVMLYILSQKGPLAVNVDSVLWRDYTGGIIQHHCTNRQMNHAVQIVAYYLNDGPVPYYVAKNQWGASFGEDGFVRIKYGDNVCGVAQEPSFVEV